MTFLYVMGVEGGFHKVGVAKNPEARLSELQTGNPKRIILLKKLDLDQWGLHPYDFEGAMHRRLAAYRACGEWFDAPSGLIMHTVKICLMEAIEHQKFHVGRPRKLLGGFMRRWRRMCMRPVFSARYSAFWAERFRESDAYCRQEVG